jgi:membrane-associated phospholipid phosphatase
MRGSRAAPWIAAAGAALAVTVGTLRITADKHYFSDVATGLAVGAAVGILVPLLHVRRAPVAIAPAPGGVSVSGAF